MIVLVCGGRDFGSVPKLFTPEAYLKARREQEYLGRVLGAAHRKYGFHYLVHGAARCADREAGIWADANNIPVISIPANWKKDGNRAGPIRNQLMLDYILSMSDELLVLAFPGGSGTEDMKTRARKAGVKVIEIPDL